VRRDIEYDEEAKEDLRALSADQRGRVRSSVDGQLVHQADIRTTNRKPTRRGALGSWELRRPPLRIFYDFDERTVTVRAILVKERNRYYRRGREVELDEPSE